MLDVFKTDAFSVVSLTDAILKAPYQPGRIGQLNLFRERGVATTTVVVEEKAGVLTLIPTTPRGGAADRLGRSARTARPFVMPHLARESTIYADEVQGVRAFGSDNQTEVIQAIVDERLATLRQMHETTLEYHRIGAIQGKLLDADGVTTIYNLFTEFGVTQQTKNFVLGTSTTDIRGACVAVARLIEAELGAATWPRLRGFCGANWFDAFVSHATVLDAFKYQQGQMLQQDLRTSGFTFGGIIWEEYRGSVGGVAFVDPNLAYVFPESRELFATYFAPADFIETANTIGLPLYTKQVADPEGLNRYVKLHSQSNPLALCLRPRGVVKCTQS